MYGPSPLSRPSLSIRPDGGHGVSKGSFTGEEWVEKLCRTTRFLLKAKDLLGRSHGLALKHFAVECAARIMKPVRMEHRLCDLPVARRESGSDNASKCDAEWRTQRGIRSMIGSQRARSPSQVPASEALMPTNTH